MALFEKPAGVMEPLLPGVGARLGCLRKGDSGRGSEGLPVGLKLGLGARAPGPRDCENFGMDGVSGLKFGRSRVEALNLVYEGVVGVGGRSEAGGARLMAR